MINHADWSHLCVEHVYPVVRQCPPAPTQRPHPNSLESVMQMASGGGATLHDPISSCAISALRIRASNAPLCITKLPTRSTPTLLRRRHGCWFANLRRGNRQNLLMLPGSNYFQTDQKERDDGRNRSLESALSSHQPQPRNDVRPRCACGPSPRSLSDAGPLVVSALRGGRVPSTRGCVAALVAFVAVALLLMVLQPPLGQTSASGFSHP